MWKCCANKKGFSIMSVCLKNNFEIFKKTKNVFFKDCPPNLWGINCENKCQCENNGTCEPYTGKCECQKGYIGELCGETCKPDFYGVNCSEVCRCENGGSCHHVSGQCICAPGFTGPL